MKFTHIKYIGKGGIKCPRCMKFPMVKRTRTKLNRIFRRKTNQEMREEAKETESQIEYALESPEQINAS